LLFAPCCCSFVVFISCCFCVSLLRFSSILLVTLIIMKALLIIHVVCSLLLFFKLFSFFGWTTLFKLLFQVKKYCPTYKSFIWWSISEVIDIKLLFAILHQKYTCLYSLRFELILLVYRYNNSCFLLI
jgi:hypothetical protein